MSMVKRWWWVGALLLVVAGAGAYSVFGAKPGDSRVGTTGDAVSQVASVPPGGAATDSSVAVGASGTVDSGTTSAKPGKKGAPSKGSPGTPVKRATIARSGAKLTTVTVPPVSTLAQMKYLPARDGQIYDVKFRLYGNGPMRAGHRSVVVVVDSSTTRKPNKDSVNLSGVNALVELGPKMQGAMKVGGRYVGVLRLLRRGDVLVIELVSARLR